MKHVVWIALGIALLGSCESPTGTVYLHGNIIDVETGTTTQRNFKVLDGIITEISDQELSGKEIIDLKGSYVLPPLYDLHTHLHGRRTELEALKQHGVFTIRDLGVFHEAQLDSLLQWRDQGLLKIYPAGFIHNGADCQVQEHKTISNIQDIEEAVAYIQKRKLSHFKIHNCFPKKLFPALDSICSQYKIKIVGHIPQGFDAIDYAQQHVSSIEHSDILLRSLFYRENNPVASFIEAVQVMESSYTDSLAVALQEHRIALTSNLVFYEYYVSTLPKAQQQMGYNLFRKIQQYTKRLYDGGVSIIPGSDFGVESVKAGASLWRELELLEEIGIPTSEVMKIAITNAANYLEEEVPEIAEGMPANFLIVKESPLEKISNIRQLEQAVFRGDRIKTRK